MYAVVDCDNCFVSCEKVFRPDLNGKPVVVLSNNDGCVVARSNEAKALGIKAGIPYYQLKQMFPSGTITVFSGNYELYGELTGRVMSLIKKSAPMYFRYSIDECFCILDGMDIDDLKTWGTNLREQIYKWIGIPVSIGIGETKTVAKMASHYAKKYNGYNHCCLIDSDKKRLKALSLYPIDEVWGVGRRIAQRFHNIGDNTALDLVKHTHDWIKSQFNISLLKTVMELEGTDCVPNESEFSVNKSICTSRSFDGMITDLDTLSTFVSNYAVRCAEKLRKQKTKATSVCVYICTNKHREDLNQYSNMKEIYFSTPSDSTIDINQAAIMGLKSIYRSGFAYKKAGVVVYTTISKNGNENHFDFNPEHTDKMKRLDSVIDRINKINGTETIILGAQQYSQIKDGKSAKFDDVIKRDFKSKNPTTRWSDIIVVK